jgi:hypothetical protein
MLNPSILPVSLKGHHETALRLGHALKQIDAPFGPLAMATLEVSTVGLTSNSPNDSTYNLVEGAIESWTKQRDVIATQIKNQLEGAEFGRVPIDEGQAASLIRSAQLLLTEAQALSSAL